MPTYEYRCEKGHTFEAMQRITEDPLSTCQVCGAPVQRVLHPVAVHFKGKGFYNTDYGTRRRARENAEHASSSSNDGEGKSDSKSSSDKAGSSEKSSTEKKAEKKAASSSPSE